jgi:hypothetical protein
VKSGFIEYLVSMSQTLVIDLLFVLFDFNSFRTAFLKVKRRLSSFSAGII